MVSKKPNKVTIPKNVTTLPQPTNELVQPMTGSPTTGNSGLVSNNTSSQLANKNVRAVSKIKTPRQRANVTSANVNTGKQTNELRISQKRQLANNLSRSLLRNEAILTRVLRYLADVNSLQDARRQMLTYGIESSPNDTHIKIDYRGDKLDQETVISGIKKHFKDVNVTPFSPSTKGQVGFYLTIKQTTVSK